ncbi:hypothetical protein RDWZM_009291 [Blomia tropicalis]|uniref:Uncharacterized protein n=1 Tax=Blomia tropicalis TaxID=40697 RepID=A0A9Q0M3E7_BLOTA|nr:hypothetical protein RDWZM_009291 [Blomia tropicalis]
MNQLNGFNEEKSDHSSKSSSSSSPQSFHPNNSINPVEQFSKSCHERLIQTLLGEHSGLINFSENKALSPQQNHKVQENECKDVSLIQFDDTGDSTKELDEIDHIEVTNYIRLKREPNFHAYLYSVKLEPPLKDRKLVRNILAYKNVMDRLKANPLILGSKIILPQQIPSFEMYPITIQDVPGCRYKLMVTFIHEIPLDDQLLLIIDLEEWVMEIWPGYARKYTKIADNELMLMCDISNVVLHRKNVYDNLKLLMPNLRFRQFACQYLVGQTVLAKYNGKTYRIDEIDFDSNPNSKFRWGSQLLTYTQYFKQHWQINIKHTKQPLLVHKKYTYQTNSYRPIYLLPELCYLTGNSMVKDCSTFYKIIAHKHPSHDLRYYKLMKYIDSVNDHVPAKNILKEWGLTIERNSYTALSDQHAEELVIKEGDNIPTFNNSNRFVKMKNFQHNLGHLKRQSLLKPVSIAGNWLVIYLRSDKFIVDCFVRDIRRVAKNMGVDLQLPRLKSLISSSPSTYLQAIKDGRETDDKIILIITPGNINVKQRYDDIRKYCTVQLGVPVQFLCGGNIGQPHLLSKISPNILMEMICKVGGTPWGIQMPLKNVCDENLITAMSEALYKYRDHNGSLPAFIIIYRDDVVARKPAPSIDCKIFLVSVSPSSPRNMFESL